MAKKTKSPLNEVEIIRWRDGVIDATPLGSLDAHSRRALADSRLRALALALKVDRTSHRANDPDDAELLAYLLEMLPEQRRRKVEMAVRGNARAFGHLMRWVRRGAWQPAVGGDAAQRRGVFRPAIAGDCRTRRRDS